MGKSVGPDYRRRNISDLVPSYVFLVMSLCRCCIRSDKFLRRLGWHFLVFWRKRNNHFSPHPTSAAQRTRGQEITSWFSEGQNQQAKQARAWARLGSLQQKLRLWSVHIGSELPNTFFLENRLLIRYMLKFWDCSSLVTWLLANNLTSTSFTFPVWKIRTKLFPCN